MHVVEEAVNYKIRYEIEKAEEYAKKVNKYFKGNICRWYIDDFDPLLSLDTTVKECYVIRGFIFNHPQYSNGVWFRSSQVISPKTDCYEGAVIETLNSVYILGNMREEGIDE